MKAGMRQVGLMEKKDKKVMKKENLKKLSGRQKAIVAHIAGQNGEEHPEADSKKMKLAMAMWLGVLADGIPESILLGFLAAERKLSLVLVISLLIANFPESFSSASLLKEGNMPSGKIITMW